MRALLCLGLSLSCAGAALAQAPQTYDLRQADDYQAQVGDRVRYEISESLEQEVRLVNPDGDELDRDDEGAQGVDEAFVERVLRVDGQGQATQVLRRYESFRDLAAGDSADVAGLEVLVTRRIGQPPRLATLDGRALPAAVRGRIEEDFPPLSEDGAPSTAREEEEGGVGAIVLPEERVAVGGTWTADANKVAASLGFGGELDPDNSEVKGRLVRAERQGGATWLVIEVDMRFSYRSLREIPCEQPTRLRCKATLRMRADGEGPDGELKVEGEFEARLRPPEMGAFRVSATGTLKRREKRERVRR